jgi:hypothetical protein
MNAEPAASELHQAFADPFLSYVNSTTTLGIAATLAAGNALLPAFMADYNARFAKPPANKKDLHRPLQARDDLEDAFAWKEEITLSY